VHDALPSLNLTLMLSVPVPLPEDVSFPAKSAEPVALLYVSVMWPETEPSDPIGKEPLMVVTGPASEPPSSQWPLKSNARFVRLVPWTSKKNVCPSEYEPV